MEYDLETKSDNEIYSTNVSEDMAHDIVNGYAIKNNKVYVNHCALGVGVFKRADKFTIDSITKDTMKVNYVIIGYTIPENPENSEEYEYGNASMTLVKENGEWKILKATIAGMCNSLYEVGK